MNRRTAKKWLPAAIACLLLAGILTPLAVLSEGGAAGQGQSQLAAYISAAESSRSYAYATVDYAVSYGLSVGGAQAQLNQGDSLLATARADALSGTNSAAGSQAVQAAMSDYTSAAAAASIALSNSGLTANVDYNAAVAAVAEVNATADVFASVYAQACTSTAAATSNAQAFAQACAQVSAQIAAARAHLSQAAAIVVQSSGHVGTTVDLSQALSLVALARTEVDSSQSAVLTIASYTYSQRGQAFIATVVIPLSAKANATIQAEQSALANLTAFQNSYASYTQSQASAAAGVTSSASALATAISQVDTSGASTSVSAAEGTAGQVSSNMSALLAILTALPSTTLQANLVSSINACSSATTTYDSALASAGTWSSAYSGTSLSSLSGYLSTGRADAAAVQSDGAAYVSSYQNVQAALSAFINAGLVPPTVLAQLQAYATTLSNLAPSVTSTSSGATNSLQQETTALTTVQTDFSTLDSVVTSSESTILVNSDILSTAATVSTEGAGYLNSAASAALAQVSSNVQATAQASQSFVAQAQACLQASVSTYSASDASLSASGVALGTQTQGSASVVMTAVAYMSSDTHARIAEAASGHSDVSQALQLFSGLDVSGGVAAMAQACLEFQAASGASV